MYTTVARSLALVSTAALAFTLTACSSNDKKDEQPGASDTATEAAATATADSGATGDASATAEPVFDSAACDLIDSATLTTITGVDFSAATATATDDTTCDWDLTESGGLSSVSVQLSPGDSNIYDATRTAAAGMFDDVTDVSVAGADHAFTYMGGMVVAFTSGNDFIQVVYVSFDENGDDPNVPLKIAEEVAGNL